MDYQRYSDAHHPKQLHQPYRPKQSGCTTKQRMALPHPSITTDTAVNTARPAGRRG